MNPSYFVDHQDRKFLGHSAVYGGRPIVTCGGMATLGSDYHAYDLAGVAIVDVETMVQLDEVPITLTSALGVTLTQNPIDASVEDGKLRTTKRNAIAHTRTTSTNYSLQHTQPHRLFSNDAFMTWTHPTLHLSSLELVQFQPALSSFQLLFRRISTSP